MGLLSWEVVIMSPYQRQSLPGASRYAAAASQKFRYSQIVLTDMDLLAGGDFSRYFQTLDDKWVSGRINIDLVYPATHKCHHLGHVNGNKSKCAKTPRFRTCYLRSTGKDFYRLYSNTLPNHETCSFQSTTGVIDCFYKPEAIQTAYAPCSHPQNFTSIKAPVPDVSFDEILFGKMSSCSDYCGDLSGVLTTKDDDTVATRQSNNCIAWAHQRDNLEHDKMIGAKLKLDSFPPDEMPAVIESAVDVHLSKNLYDPSITLNATTSWNEYFARSCESRCIQLLGNVDQLVDCTNFCLPVGNEVTSYRKSVA